MTTRSTLGFARRLRGALRYAAVASLATLCSFGLAGERAYAAEPFTVASPGLADGAMLDSRHAASANQCGGGDVSPALQWRNAPAGTKSFAVTIFDPDGAKGLGVVHWVLYGIAPSITSFAESRAAPQGALAGTNQTGGPGYHGPCPPIGDAPHHYVAQVYALDLPPDALAPGLSREQLLAALKGHVLAASSIVLRYAR